MMRCYNGCPDTELQALLDENDRLRAEIIRRGFWVTYFPNGEFFQVFNASHLPVTGEHKTLSGVVRELSTFS